MLLASALSFRFSILAVLEDTIPRQEEHVRRNGIDPSRLASVRSVGIPVVDVREDIPVTVQRLIEAGRLAVQEDEAQAVILGCLGFANMGRAVQEKLGVPVIDPAFAAVNLAETLVVQGLSHSRRSYPKPPEKERRL
jgi:allantoin racemase